MTADAILARLAELSKLIESYKGASYLLELERFELQARLRGTDWKPPVVPA